MKNGFVDTVLTVTRMSTLLAIFVVFNTIIVGLMDRLHGAWYFACFGTGILLFISFVLYLVWEFRKSSKE